MKLTDKQRVVYEALCSMSSTTNFLTNSQKNDIQKELSFNPVSFGLVIKALIDKSIIKMDKNGDVTVLNSDIPSESKVSKVVPIKIKEEIVDDKKEVKKVFGDTFTYSPIDFNQNLFYELKLCGANFNPSKYSFFSKNVPVVEKMKEIIEFYETPNDSLSKSQRILRDNIINKHNIDMECKKIGDKLYFLNTWGIASTKDVVKDIINSGRKKVVVSDNRIIVDIDNNN